MRARSRLLHRRGTSHPRDGNAYRRSSRSGLLVDSWEERGGWIYVMTWADAFSVWGAGLFVVDVQQGENFFGCYWHERLERVGDDTQSFDQVREDLRNARQASRIFGKRERRGRDDIFVCRVQRLPDGFQSAIECELLDQRCHPRRDRGEALHNRDVERVAASAGRGCNRATEVARRHREYAAGQVAEVVGEVRVVAIDHALFGEIAVEAVGEFAQDEEAQHVGSDVFLI